jgi:hypothetical protein
MLHHKETMGMNDHRDNLFKIKRKGGNYKRKEQITASWLMISLKKLIS